MPAFKDLSASNQILDALRGDGSIDHLIRGCLLIKWGAIMSNCGTLIAAPRISTNSASPGPT